MSAGTDRRQPGARVPFEALVEIAAPEGAAFEAESIDLSTSGMHLRTAYMPKVGTPLTFRFEGAEGRDAIVVRGEVVWNHDGDGACEFGVRFSEVDERDAEAIQKIVGCMDEAKARETWSANGMRAGSSVRIHIEGMSAPMRATLLGEQRTGASVVSELKMLRLGAEVELEDKERKTRRPARVDTVACEIDPETHVPQLVVKLRYPDGASAEEGAERELPFLPTKKVPMPADVETAAKDVQKSTLTPPPVGRAPQETEARASATSEPPRAIEPSATASQRQSLPVAHEDEGRLDGMKEGMKTFGAKMKDAFGAAAKMTTRLGARVGTTVALLAQKKDKDDSDGARRTTSSFATQGTKPRMLRPQGSARDFGNGEEEVAMEEIDMTKAARRRQIGIAAGLGVAVVLGFLAFRKPHTEKPVVQAPAPELAPAAAPPPAPAPPPALPDPALAAAAPAPAPLVGDSTGVDAKGNPNPFGTPAVKKGTKMLLRLDGPVSEIKGMQMPNGFVVSVPNRKSLEAAGPLAAKDPRIGSAKVVNQPGGAELTIAFKDGSSPPYVVKAKGDALEIVLGHEKAVAKKNKKKDSAPAKHHKKK